MHAYGQSVPLYHMLRLKILRLSLEIANVKALRHVVETVIRRQWSSLHKTSEAKACTVLPSSRL